MKSVVVFAFILLGMIILSGIAHAEVFKWVDANGKVHYSDRKMTTQAQKLNVKTGAKSVGQNTKDVEQRLMQQKKYVNYLQAERLERQEKRQEAKAAEDKKKKVCAALRDQLKSYTQGNYRWYELDEASGERNYISDDGLEAKKVELRTEIKSNCS